MNEVAFSKSEMLELIKNTPVGTMFFLDLEDCIEFNGQNYSYIKMFVDQNDEFEKEIVDKRYPKEN